MLSSDELKTLRQEGIPDDFILESVKERDPQSGAELSKLIEEGIPASFILDEISSRMAPAKQAPTAEEAQRESRLSTFNKKGILAKLGGALQYGTAEAAAGYGKTGELVGSPTVTGIAGTVERAARPNDYVPASEGWNHPTKDDTTIFGKGVGYIPRMAVESLPGMGVDLLAASATGGLGALATYGARRIGQNVEQVAQNNNRDLAHATAGDMAQGGLATGVETALNTLGLRGMGGTATRSVTDLAKQAGKSALVEGGTEAAQEGATQALTSVGTEKGYRQNFNGGDIAASLLTGGLVGGGVRAAHSGQDVTAAVKFRDIDPQRATNLREYLGGLGVEPDSTKSALDLLKLGDKQLNAQISHERQSLQPMFKTLDEQTPGAGRDLRLKIDETLNGIAHGSENVDGLLTELKDTLGTTRQGQSLIQALENKDTLYRLRQTGQDTGEEFKGGIARHIENLSPFGKISGLAAAGLGGSQVIPGVAGIGSLGAMATSLSSAGSAAAAGLGVYGAARGIDRVTGARNPVQTFMDASRGKASPAPDGPDFEAQVRQQQFDEQAERAKARQESKDATEALKAAQKAQKARAKLSGNGAQQTETAASEAPRASNGAPSVDTVNYRGVDITIPSSVRSRDRYLAGAKSKQDQIAGHIEEAMNSGVSDETSSFLAKNETLLRSVRNRKDAKAALERVLAKAPQKDRAALEEHFGADYLSIWSKENDGQ